MFVCYATPLPFTYLETTLQHPRHKIRKAPSRPNFSYLSGNFSSCVTYNVMVNITIIQQKPQNFQERQKRRDRLKVLNVHWEHLCILFKVNGKLLEVNISKVTSHSVDIIVKHPRRSLIFFIDKYLFNVHKKTPEHHIKTLF